MHIDEAIRSRTSRKVLANTPEVLTSLPESHFDNVMMQVQESLEVAGMAPFHYPADMALGGHAREPWRCVVLHRQACVELKTRITTIAGDADGPKENPKAGKMFALLDAAEALVLVYVAVEAAEHATDTSKLDVRNMEHMLAAGAFVQNLLLSLTSRDLHNYWSSGGILKSELLNASVRKPNNSELAAAVFVNSPANSEHSTIKPGRWRSERKGSAAWSDFLRTLS